MAVGAAALAQNYWSEMELEDAAESALWLRRWIIRGLAVPILCWLLFAGGLFNGFFSLIPELENLKGMAWLAAYEKSCAFGVAAIVTYWAAATLLSMLVIIARSTEDRRDFNTTFVVWSIILLPVAVFVVWCMGWGFAGVACVLWMLPVYNSCSHLTLRRRKPEYNRAVTNMQFGNYRAAEAAVIQELELNQADFDGWMVLAELYALHFNDLAAADRTVREICDEPTASVSQIAAALQKLADWHLKVGQDPETARRVLEEICRRLPGTHLDRMARLRINQLPRTKAEYLKQLEVKRIQLPGIQDAIESYRVAEPSVSDRQAAAAEANRLVDTLKANPNDLAARESLARVLAERLSDVPQAVEQMELLLALPGIERPKAAAWLNLMAAWQIRIQRDEAAAETLLERVTRACPNSAEAFTAQRRLNLMRRESRARPAINPAP